jgi:hypothetical protein
MFAIEGSEAPCTGSLCPLLSTFPFAAFSFPNIVGIPQLPVAGEFPITQIAKCEQKDRILGTELEPENVTIGDRSSLWDVFIPGGTDFSCCPVGPFTFCNHKHR